MSESRERRTDYAVSAEAGGLPRCRHGAPVWACKDETPVGGPELRAYSSPAGTTSALEQTAHYAALCRCHRDLWGPLCAPYLHGTVPLVLDVDTAKRIVTCVYCRADMTKRGLFDPPDKDSC